MGNQHKPQPCKTIGILLALSMLFGFPSAGLAADAYPSKTVRVVIPMPPGGGTDFVARVLINKLSERLAESVIPDNRGGA